MKFVIRLWLKYLLYSHKNVPYLIHEVVYSVNITTIAALHAHELFSMSKLLESCSKVAGSHLDKRADLDLQAAKAVRPQPEDRLRNTGCGTSYASGLIPNLPPQSPLVECWAGLLNHL